MAANNTGAVVSALVANSFLTVLKFAAFAVSGSGAMLSEGFHSLADTANQGLLFVGIRRSERPADEMFRYGRGGERYLFALLSAVGVFVLGCGVTVYHGVSTLLHPHELDIAWWLYVVLGVSFAVDLFVLLKAWKAVKADKGNKTVREFLDHNTDPTAVAVLLEDGAACLGILFALLGILLYEATGNPLWDSLASITIGGMLGLIAVVLGVQNSRLILGRRIPLEVRESALAYLRAQDSVVAVAEVQSRVLGAGTFKLKAQVDFDGRALGRPLAPWVSEHLPTGGDAGAIETFSAEFGEQVMERLAAEVDRIESDLQERHPQLKQLDFEAD